MLKPDSILHWLRHRDLTYVGRRALALLKRYGLTPKAAQGRIVDGVKLLARYGCSPTFPTPGRVVDAHPQFCRTLQSMGVELAVHGYDHVDFRSLSTETAGAQFSTAVRAFADAQLKVSGFRCPYLSYDATLFASLPSAAFRYSSNRAFWWDVIPQSTASEGNAIFRTLQSFYRADSACDAVVTPTLTNGLVEIPASIPDDLQLYDGLKLGVDGVTTAWAEILKQTYHRGELFTVLFHPESFSQCSAAFEAILGAALTLQPQIWIAQLRDVAEWWREKQGFAWDVEEANDGFRLKLHCSSRATILVRGIAVPESLPWFGAYRRLATREILLLGGARPFIGVDKDVPLTTLEFLRDQGYLVARTDDVQGCTLHLTMPQVLSFRNERELIDFIEADQSPLVRFWRWPDNARSAICITGDLDALCLLDYVRRLLPSPRRIFQTEVSYSGGAV